VSASLLKTVPLSNGLMLEFWDESRPTAGDRWYVGVRAVVAVPLAGPVTEGAPAEIIGLLKRAVGGSIRYRFLKERHFIPADEAEGQKRELIRIFLDNDLKYLAHPRFAENFIRRKVQEIREKRDWPEEHLEKILEDLRQSN